MTNCQPRIDSLSVDPALMDGLLPPTHPDGQHRMAISTRPQDWAEPARSVLFGAYSDLHSGYGGHRV